MLFSKIGIVLPVVSMLWCDNVSASGIASNLVFHARTKHIEVDYHFIQDKVLSRDILVKFISIGNQTSYIHFHQGSSFATLS